MKIQCPVPDTMRLSVEDGSEKLQRQMWGTTRTLIANAITGMTEGFSVPLYLVGVGYRVAMEEDPRGTSEGGTGKRLSMKVGYSHTVYVPIPPYIKAEVPSPTKIVLFCTDKHLLGLFAAKIRGYRVPEPYKGKASRFRCWSLTAFDASHPGYFRRKRDYQNQEREKEVEELTTLRFVRSPDDTFNVVPSDSPPVIATISMK
ncbi:hypothetical protein NLJ89_g3636 [Agrocybe chaxingu]|uniref:Large ribosomal subunit protein uL6 alpha-beta domain-containing protein n=1 Tax=Agrocybe chaxingu TaxID=84603 RepID=A0A9W8KAS8_9AGAR|nr:hypothetical protein NLJ89_g3636 [Agrocybe chaxingu]